MRRPSASDLAGAGRVMALRPILVLVDDDGARVGECAMAEKGRP